MTVKKLALLGVASVAALGMSISVAGGPATCAPAADLSGVYVGVNLGAMYNNSLKFDTTSVSSTTPIKVGNVYFTSVSGATFKQSPWTWTVDALVGYQFNNNWALQFGYIWNQEQKFSGTAQGVNASTGFSSQGISLKLQSYNLYLALRGTLPLTEDFGAYMLVGPAWTHLSLKADFSGSATDTKRTDSFWSPMAGLGVSWHVADGFGLNLQYTYILSDLGTGAANSLRGYYRGTQRITIGADYLFAM